jgi:hypothetical protein
MSNELTDSPSECSQSILLLAFSITHARMVLLSAAPAQCTSLLLLLLMFPALREARAAALSMQVNLILGCQAAHTMHPENLI